jgi:hypothetical protein
MEFVEVNTNTDKTPIIMVDNSGSTCSYMKLMKGYEDKPVEVNDDSSVESLDSDSDSDLDEDPDVKVVKPKILTADVSVLEHELQVITNILREKGVDQSHLMFWDNKVTFPYGEKELVNTKDITGLHINSKGGTSLGQALEQIPSDWYKGREFTELYIVTDGEIWDNDENTADLIRKLFNHNVRLHIVTVEPNNRDYLRADCNAGTSIYQLVHSQQLTNYVRTFTSYNNIFVEDGFVGLDNPEIVPGHASFRGKYFQIDKTASFIKYLDNVVEQTPDGEMLKLAHDVSFTVYQLIKGKPLCIKRGIINMVCMAFSDTEFYKDIREMLLKETDNIEKGQANTYQGYKRNRERVFEAAQISLYDDVVSCITNGESHKYVSFPTNTQAGTTIISAPYDKVTETIDLVNKSYKRSALKIGDYTVPMLPVSVIMDKDFVDQCVRQWIRTNYGKKLNVNVAADVILYYFLTDALCVHFSDASEDVKKAYRDMSRVMLNRKRFGTKISEWAYLNDNNPPAPVTGNADQINYLLSQCAKYGGCEDVEPFTLWYGIVNMLNDDLADIQYKFCKDDMVKNGVTKDTIMDFLKGKMNKFNVFEYSCDQKWDYTCYITLESTSKTGGYAINPHNISKRVTCAPQYVMCKDVYEEFAIKGTVSCPLCQTKLSTNDFNAVKSEDELLAEYAAKQKDMVVPVVDEKYYDTTKHTTVKITDDMYKNNDVSKLYSLDECDFDTVSYTIDAPVVEEALGNRRAEIKTQEEFNTSVKTRYPFLSEVDFTGTCIAGGFCRSIMLRQRLKDIDFFFYGDNKFENFMRVMKQTCKAVKKDNDHMKFLIMYKPQFNVFEVVCVSDPTNFLNTNFDLHNFKQYDFKSLHRYDRHVIIDPETGKVYRKKGKWDKEEEDEEKKDIEDEDHTNYFEDGDVTGIRMKQRLQFILCDYKTKEDILMNFDMFPCRVLYDGKTTYFTERSMTAFKYMINIVNENNYSTLFDHRLSKYFTYGFSIVLPELDINKMKELSFLKFSEISFRVKRVDGKTVMIDHNSHIEDQLKSLESLEKKNADKGKSLYKSSLFCSFVSLLRYVKINDINYLFTDDYEVDMDDDKSMKFRESEAKIHFIDNIDSRIEGEDLYKEYRVNPWPPKEKEVKEEDHEHEKACAKKLDSDSESDSDTESDTDSEMLTSDSDDDVSTKANNGSEDEDSDSNSSMPELEEDKESNVSKTQVAVP